MLTSATVIVKPRHLFPLLAAANKFGVEVTPGDGEGYFDIEGKTDKVNAALATVPHERVGDLESFMGDPEGFGTASDLVSGRNVYRDLVGKPVFEV